MKRKHLTKLFITTLLSGVVCLVPNSASAKGGGGSSGGGSHGSSHSSGSHGGSVGVSGYTRSNGTYVHPYTRSTSGSGSGDKSSKGGGGSSDESSSGGGSHSSGSPGESVGVSGYTRSNGTYVHPYTRSTSESGEKSSDGYSNSPEYSDSPRNNSDSDSNTTFQDALDTGESAATLTQSAISKDDWELVTFKWQRAIALLKEVPASNPYFAQVQIKIQEYSKNLNNARKQLSVPSLTQSEEVATQETSKGEFQQNEQSSQVLVTPAKNAAVTASVSPSPKVTPTSSTEVVPEEESNPLGAIISTALVIIVAIGFYKAKTINKLAAKSAPRIE